MGIDGSEIKRRREKTERKVKPIPLETKSSEPEQNTTETKKDLPPSAFNVIGKIAGFCLLVIVILGFIINSIEDHSYSHTKTTTTTKPASYTSSSSADSFAEIATALLNTMYGNVCKAELEDWFTKTLRIDWTSNTTMFHTIKVMSEVGNIKEKLYRDGVRYFKFPNDAGTYNIIDWETGNKESNTEQAPYYFRE